MVKFVREFLGTPLLTPNQNSRDIVLRRTVIFLLLALVAVPGRLFAKTTAPSTSAIQIPGEQAPVVDGELTDPVWGKATPITRFVQRDPNEGEPASEVTEVRILYTRKAIYFGVYCHDSQPELVRATELSRDDRLENDDTFSILLDTFHDRRNAFLFRSNALGTRFDAQINDERRRFNTEWDEKWSAVGRRHQGGWTLEIEIPFKSLRSGAGDNLTWGMNLERIIVRKNEETYWAGYSRDYGFWNVSQAGELTGLNEIRTGLRLRVKPYVLGGLTLLPGNGGGAAAQNESQFGLEVVKASLTPSITADLAINPDFAQAEVDEARFNLTRFSLFFPEKREFFLERAGIFNFGTRRPQREPPEVLAFFSRQIGLVDGEPIPITAGTRLTGSQDGFEFGLLNVLTRERGDFAGDNSTAIRVKRTLLERSYVGGILTQRTLSGSDHFNRLGGLDANFVLFDKLTASGYWAKTVTRGQDKDSLSYQASFVWNSDRWEWEASRTRIDEDFNPELGFVLRDDVIKHRARAAWKPRPRNSWIRQWRISTVHQLFTSQKGFLESRENEFFVGASLESGDFLGAVFNSNYETLTEDFELHPEVNIPAGHYASKEVAFFARAYEGRPVSGFFRFRAGQFFDGKLINTTVGPLFKVNENLSVEFDHNFSKASLPWGDFTVNLVDARINYNLTNRLLTSTSVQYNNVERQFRINWRLNYIYRPGDDLFIVYNEGRDFNHFVPGLINRTFLIKFTHSFDF